MERMRMTGRGEEGGERKGRQSTNKNQIMERESDHLRIALPQSGSPPLRSPPAG